MSTRDKILEFAKRKGTFGTQDLVEKLKVSRQTLSSHLSRLVREGKLRKTGSTRSARYGLTRQGNTPSTESHGIRLIRKLKGLEEDRVASEVTLRLGLSKKVSENTNKIFKYAFTEMLNNAIDHSTSANCSIEVGLVGNAIHFLVSDHGIGAYANVQKGFKLKSEFEAMEHLFKGKQTTSPTHHSGQGIFFTSRIADRFALRSHRIEAVRDNLKKDLFIKDIAYKKGTEVEFLINKRTRKSLKELFDEFSDEDFQFDRNTVHVKLSQEIGPLSRSEARRLLFGLEKFKRVIFDFAGVKEIGQAFADEIFRVYANQHPEMELTFVNTSPAISFMITRAIRATAGKTKPR